jgi:hypothetical protein
VLPDDVLLDVFDFYRDVGGAQSEYAWQSLVHVCRRWRGVVFGSARRLDLHLLCTARTPARDALNLWPAFPLHIRSIGNQREGINNIIAVLERSDRVRVIILADISSSDLEKLSAAMEVPFPELTDLGLWSDKLGEVVLPDSFLGGSAPRLQYLSLDGISFPGLPKLLLSATHLVQLYLQDIPHSGYISPDAMLTILSTLTGLDKLRLGFQSPRSRPDRATRHLPPPTRSVLSVLTFFSFKGDSEYLDDLVAHIDTPRLHKLGIIFFNQIVFDTPQLIRFICRTPALKPLQKAYVFFSDSFAIVNFTSLTSNDDLLHVGILCRDLDWQVSSVEQVCTSSLPSLSTLENLYIIEGASSQTHGQDNIENALWLELLHPFRAVKNLYLSEGLALRIVPALQVLVGSRATEVLPTLRNIFLERIGPWTPSRPVEEGTQQFVAARQFTGDPIAVSRWNGLDY